mmetsp:Transcript_15001/g.31472  ORF Transcript_15001/g.31472 Transcript_15001/m.31472 type:complete len:676 (+) Transcript_15001:140-2167(+)
MANSLALENAINETRNVLQPLFSKPKLTTKLLTKPPFRFIHDIISATIKSTDFPNGYFTPDEMDSSNFKDSKTVKISFLNKFIHLVNVANGFALDVNSTKIVAGLEPLHTNILLVKFGRTAQDNKIDRESLIRHCLNGLGIEEFWEKKVGSKTIVNASVSKNDHEATAENETNHEVDQNRESDHRPLSTKIDACNKDLTQTKLMISRLVAKPKCSDKLLSKPPFRFIHDLIMAIGHEAHFDLGRIFSEDEMESSNVKEKQAKLQFLEKLIKFLESELSMSINVKPIKIVSGQEPELTCYMLQIFTVLVTHKPSPRPSASADQEEGSSSKVPFHGRDESTAQLESQEMQKNGTPSESKVNEYHFSSKPTPTEISMEPGEVLLEFSSVKSNNIDRPLKPEDTEPNIIDHETEEPLKSLNSIEFPFEPECTTDEEEDIPDGNRTSIRITARRGPPRKKEKTDKPEDDFYHKDRAHYSIIEDEEESPSLELRDEVSLYANQQSSTFFGAAKANDSGLNSHTAIVQKIVDEQEQVEGNDDDTETKSTASGMRLKLHRNNLGGKNPIIPPTKMTPHDLKSIAETIQRIAQATVPLARYNDGNAEEIMRERQYWIDEQKELEKALDVAKIEREKHLKQLRKKLNSLEDQLHDKVEEIRRLECTLGKNDDVIRKQLANISNVI